MTYRIHTYHTQCRLRKD